VDTHPELVNYAVRQPPEMIAAAISAALAAHNGL
jgi:pyruvate carboxylase subunit A